MSTQRPSTGLGAGSHLPDQDLRAVDAALESLAAPVWTREPDWATFKEKHMNQVSSPRSRRGPAFWAIVAGATLCTAAAATIVAYTVTPFRGVIHLDDGTQVPVTGEIVTNGDQHQVTIDTEQDITAPGSGEFVLPDGTRIRVVAMPNGGGEGKPAESKPAEPAKPTKPQ